MKPSLILLSFFFFISVSLTQAQIPQTINYQGVLTDNSGQVVADDNYALTFRLYDASSGGNTLWEESRMVPVEKGLFDVILGEVVPINLPFDNQYWLGITINTSSELEPRTKLTSVAYSLNTKKLQGRLVSETAPAVDQVLKWDGTQWKPSVDATAQGTGGDNLGDHTATQNIMLSNHWLSGDGDDEGIYVNKDGNVGVGTRDSSAYGQRANLTVMGYSMLDSIRISGTDVGGNQILIDKPSGFGIVNQAGPMIFRTGGDSPNFNRMTIDINGNVGIGIPNPDSKLEIAGQIKITGGSPGNNKVLTSDEYGLGLWKTPPSSPWKNIGTSIRYDGGVGIGVDAWDLTGLTVYNIPSFGMGVGGEFTAGDFGVRGNAYAGSSSYIACGVTGYASGNEDSYVVGVYASTWGEGKRLAIYADGDIVCTGELIGPPSDLMLKQNIQPFSAINRIMKLEPKSFMFISGSQYAHINLSPGKHYGLVAQELEKVFPELVVDAIHPSVEEMRGEKGGEEIHYKGVKYIELIPILIQAVQEQQKTIEELTKRIEQLERR